MLFYPSDASLPRGTEVGQDGLEPLQDFSDVQPPSTTLCGPATRRLIFFSSSVANKGLFFFSALSN